MPKYNELKHFNAAKIAHAFNESMKNITIDPNAQSFY